MIIKIFVLITFFFLPFLSVCQILHKFKIAGTVENLKDNSWIFLKNDNYNQVVDSVKVFHNHFEFRGQLNEPTHLTIIVNNYTLPLMASEKDSQILIRSDSLLENVKITGSILNDERQEFDSHIQKKYKDTINDLLYKLSVDSVNFNNKEKKDSIINEIQSSRNNFYNDVKNYVLTNSNSELSLYLLYIYKNVIDINQIKALYNSLQNSLKNFPIANLILQYINVTSVGSIAPDFKLYNLKGNLFQLHKYKSKGFILIDFWASWCEPCLKDIEKIKSINTQYNKGLNIISISIDTDSIKWINTIKKLSSGLIELLDTKKRVADKYFIETIPKYFLLDKDYKILETTDDLFALKYKLDNYYFINDGIGK